MPRKKIKIDWSKVDKMLEAGCTGTECAASLGIHEDTLYNACEREHKTGFSAYRAQKRAAGDVLLRVAQFKKALGGETSMQIWLGKNRLGQSDKVETSFPGVSKVEFELVGKDNGSNE